MADAEIDRRIKLRIVELVDDVRPDDAELRRAVRDEGRDVEGADADQRNMRMVRPEHQRAALLVEEICRGLDTDGRQQRQRQIGRTSCREKVCQYEKDRVCAESINTKRTKNQTAKNIKVKEN